MNNNRFKWQRRDGAWHLWRGVETTDGAVIWQETKYTVRVAKRGWVSLTGSMWWWPTVADAKCMAESLAQNSR